MSRVTATPLDPAEAVRISTRLTAASETPPWGDVVRAFQGRAWEVLRYRSWDEYCQSVFVGGPIVLAPQERAERVEWLRGQGLTVRAIAAVIDASKSTISADSRRSNGLRVNGAATNSPTRRKLPILFRKPVLDVSRATRRLAELMKDDRFRSNRAVLAREYATQLRMAHDELTALINAIGE